MKPSKFDNTGPEERRLMDGLSILKRKVERLAKNATSVEQLTAEIAALTASPTWRKLAMQEAVRMVRTITVKNAANWREAAQKAGQGYKIFKSLQARFANNRRYQALIQQNASYIRTLPDALARRVTKRAATEAIRGQRPEAVMSYIRQHMPEMSNAQIRLIARTETAKSQAAITEIQAQDLGLQWYVWATVEDNRVRSSHDHMEGVLCRFDDPPAPEVLIGKPSEGHYNPGNIYNCRCSAQPLIDVDFITWPAKVYYNGTITRMSKQHFIKVTGFEGLERFE